MDITTESCRNSQGCDVTFPKPGNSVARGKVVCAASQTGFSGTCNPDADVTLQSNGNPAQAPVVQSSDNPDPGPHAFNNPPNGGEEPPDFSISLQMNQVHTQNAYPSTELPASQQPAQLPTNSQSAGPSSNQQPAVPSVTPAAVPAPSSPSQETGSCNGSVKCSDDGMSFFLCGPTGWIPMGRLIVCQV